MILRFAFLSGLSALTRGSMQLHSAACSRSTVKAFASRKWQRVICILKISSLLENIDIRVTPHDINHCPFFSYSNFLFPLKKYQIAEKSKIIDDSRSLKSYLLYLLCARAIQYAIRRAEEVSFLARCSDQSVSIYTSLDRVYFLLYCHIVCWQPGIVRTVPIRGTIDFCTT